jgi:hypothetical protein
MGYVWAAGSYGNETPLANALGSLNANTIFYQNFQKERKEKPGWLVYNMAN